jgi:hypothetical protein
MIYLCTLVGNVWFAARQPDPSTADSLLIFDTGGVTLLHLGLI